MSERPIEGLMDTTLEKIKQMVDVNTVIGDPITTPDGATIIPVSKVVYGFAAGGSEFSPKRPPADKNLFGGGSGAGVTITPLGFISIYNGEVKMLRMESYSDSTDRAVGIVPEIIDKVVSLLRKDKNTDEQPDSKAKDTVDAQIDDPKV